MTFFFVVGSFYRQKAHFTTVHLAESALRAGHRVVFAPITGFYREASGEIGVVGHGLDAGECGDRRGLVKSLWRAHPCKTPFPVGPNDVVFLRFNPAQPELASEWPCAIEFATHLRARGVPVVNDPLALTSAASKLFVPEIAPELHPETAVLRDLHMILDFVARQKKPVILKPARGFGGRNVFLIRSPRDPNLKQIAENLLRNGPVVAQRHVPGDRDGDLRVLLFDGEPVVAEGQTAAYRRLSPRGEIRSNMSLGATPAAAKLSREERGIVEALGPKLKHTGLRFVGADIVGSYVIELNVFCSGGLEWLWRLHGVDFAAPIIAALAREKHFRPHRAERDVTGLTT